MTSKMRNSMGGHHSATKRAENSGPRGSVQNQAAAHATASGQNMMFPPLNETSFSEQYKNFKALGGKKHPVGSHLGMSKDLQMRIYPMAANKPYYRRNLQGPNMDARLPAGYASGEQMSVFQTNASHVMSSPQTYNMFADASTAPYPLDNSMFRSPQGKLKLSA